MILAIAVLILAAMSLIVAGVIIGDEFEPVGFVALMFGVLFLSLGVYIAYIEGSNEPIKSDKEIKPSIEITCKDGQCDTTYIYYREQ